MVGPAAGDGAPVIVAFPPEIDVANASQLGDLLIPAIDSGTRVIVADLSGTDFCDAAGVRQLVVMGDQVASRGGQLRLVIRPDALLRRLLVLLRADHLLSVYASAQEASRPMAAPEYPLLVLRQQPARTPFGRRPGGTG
jgi:anti-sigma B factor antagonist